MAIALATAMTVAACGGASGRAPNPDVHDSYATLIGAGTKLLSMGNVGAAQQLFLRAIPKKANDPVGYYDLGLAYERNGNLREANLNYLHALRLDRYYVPALYNAAGIFAKRNVPLAIFYYRRIIAAKPDAPTAFLQLGLLEFGHKATRMLAIHDFAQAVKLDPSLRAQVPGSVRNHLVAGRTG